MTFRDTGSANLNEVSAAWAPATQPRRRGRTALATKTEVEPEFEPMGDIEVAVELEETPALSEEALRPSAPEGEDPVRIYLKEIGKVPLLTADQEVTIGRRIEVGQIALRRALARVPLAVTRLLELGDQVRRGELAVDTLMLLPGGRGDRAG